ncbi:MAG: hypothetical protein RL398_3551 [Planctomycetota bacterium]
MAAYTFDPGSRGCALALAVWAVVGGLSAQQVMIKPPVGVEGGAAATDAGDRGAPVELFENANLDRYLRRAEAFLQRADFAAAIQVLQDVAEGRTPIEVGGEPSAEAPTAGGSQANSGGEAPLGQDERHAVYASDGRLFRPVRRLGQEMLAKMPPAGLALYRTLYDGDAERALQAAEADGSLRALQTVVERYYASAAAGRALALLGDRSLSEGRYRAAVRHFRELLDIYPANHRSALGIGDLWLRYKVALALALAGDRQGAAVVAELAREHADETLRIAGELQAVRELPDRPPFVGNRIAVDDRPSAAVVTWLHGEDFELVPLWQYRFAEADPYRDPTNRPRGSGISPFDENQLSNSMPHAGRYFPGTRVRFLAGGEAGRPPQVAFFEHFRLRIADAASGLMLAEGDGSPTPPAARDSQPRVRIAACDFALLHAMEHEGMLLGVLGYSRKPTSSTQVLRETELVAYDRASMRRRWSSENWLDGERGLRDVTFLAAPTPFGDRLLVPTLRKGVYSLDCLAAADGRPMWTTPLHAGGSEFFKAPGVQVVVEGAVAYVATNAGCLAAVDVWSGDLQWIRRYERRDPLRKSPVQPVVRDRNVRFVEQRMFAQVALEGFYPSELIARDGLVVLAPVDGDMLICLDGASGEPVWMFDAASRYAPFGRLRALLGVAEDALFACSDSHLVCFSLRGGLVRWARELPPDAEAGKAGRGRGAVVGNHVVVPGMRELLAFDVAGRLPMQRIALPSFGAGREPLAGSFYVQSQGPWLAIGYAGGVEVFSTRTALGAAATATTDPFVRASLLQHAGDPLGAEGVLAAVADNATASTETRDRAARALLSATRMRAVRLAETDLGAAMALLDARRPGGRDGLLLQWHLARLDCAQAAGDLVRLGEEQQRLYDVMEGKR